MDQRTVMKYLAFAALFITCLADSLPYEGTVKVLERYELPDLPYGYGDLEPYIDEATVRVHHQGHHAGYTNKLNTALSNWRINAENGDLLASKSIFEILQQLSEIPDSYKGPIRNFGGGFVNHNLYWSVMSPNPQNETRMAEGELLQLINSKFDSFSNFKSAFTIQANKLFGSGYVWLNVRLDNDGKEDLVISTTVNQDSPISEGLYPILVIDVWEHAYYLKHQNLRINHVESWWKLVDWNRVHELRHWWKNILDQEKHEEL
ncbi:superoxide dismutase [Mn]-like [Glandiceps talaboti]